MAMQVKPRRDALLVAILFLIATNISVFAVARLSATEILREYQSKIEIVAKTAALMTDGDLHNVLVFPDQKGSPEYRGIQAPYKQLLQANPEIAYIYTAIMNHNNVYLVVDTKQPRVKNDTRINVDTRTETAEIRELYTDVTPKFLESLRTGKVLIEDDVQSDDWGNFISGYAPFYDGAGTQVGVVGVDFDAKDFVDHINSIWIIFANGCLISLLLTMMIYIIALDLRRKQLARRALRDGFNYEMKDHTKTIAVTSDTIYGEASTIAVVIDETAKFAGEAMGNVFGTASRVKSVAETSEVMVKSLGDLRGIMDQYRLEIASAAEQVKNAQEMATKLVSANNQVNDMMAEIPKITGKINLLALNATIESARAGEAGKGFAVVANEVKMLAGQTYDVTKGISGCLEEGKVAAQQTINLVGGMASIVHQAQTMVEGTSRIIDEHSDMLKAVNDDIQEVSHLTKTMENSIQELKTKSDGTGDIFRHLEAGVRDLSDMNKNLNRRVSQFLDDFVEKHRGSGGKT